MPTKNKNNPAPEIAVQPQPPTTLITSIASGAQPGTKVALQTSYAGLVAGLQANYAPGDVFPLASGNLTRDEVIAPFTQYIADAEATKVAYQGYRACVETEHQQELSVAPLHAEVKSILEARYGKVGQALLQYGITPRKTRVESPATRAAAAVKAKATRVARGTKGSKQKLAVTGDVTGVVITPVTSAPAPAPAPSPNVGPAAPGPARGERAQSSGCPQGK